MRKHQNPLPKTVVLPNFEQSLKFGDTHREEKILIFGYKEVSEYFYECLKRYIDDDEDWVKSHYLDIHYYCFSKDYINPPSKHQAITFLGDNVYDCISYINKMELKHRKKIYCDHSNPVKIMTNYFYWIGKIVVRNYYDQTQLAKYQSLISV